MQSNTRLAAARAIESVIVAGRSVDAALAAVPDDFDNPRDRAFVRELVYGVLRWYWRLKPLLDHLMKKPLRERDRDVEMLLLVGLYQQQFLATAEHAAVGETVAACAPLGKSWARGLVNGILRNALRSGEALARVGTATRTGSSAHPEWLVEAFERDWPAAADTLFDANNARAPLTLRVNRLRGSREDYLARLAAADIAAVPTKHAPAGVRLELAVPVEMLPGFVDGDVSVQDEAAQLAASVLEISRHSRVLDACAAPGGKTAHILESFVPSPELVAIDHVAERVATLETTLERLQLSAQIHCADAASVEQWWDGRTFDRILIDAPCSGTGVIRRHPDIKHLRRPDDLPSLAAQQARLLDSLWPLLRRGGKLVYATCSVLLAENDDVVGAFLARTSDATADPITAPWGTPTGYGRQILTGSDDMDGFYYARITRREA